ncbi:AidA/PixA family protein [Hyalangium minutum]|uniref:AidA n=1 Tax=Hyalangium minutum TaxID=394096 RepID=A0A085W2R4_9BACT|nr:AidA/PixA family protein [Hyalangium minutum]KFE61977.1 AidA [Hyalangium minutum]
MADTEQLIDILVVIDAESVMAQFGSVQPPPTMQKPTSIGKNSNLVYMFVKYDEVVKGDASSNLNVSVHPNNVIRWRGTSLTLNTQYSVMLYACDIAQGQNLISQPTPITPSVTVQVPTLSGNTVTGTTAQNFQDFYFQSVGEGAGSVSYTFSFVITDNSGTPLGYFKWDPSLIIS